MTFPVVIPAAPCTAAANYPHTPFHSDTTFKQRNLRCSSRAPRARKTPCILGNMSGCVAGKGGQNRQITETEPKLN